MIDVLPIFAERLLRLVNDKKFANLKDFAAKIGIPYTTVNSWVLQKRCPSVNYLRMVADFFSVSADYLIGIKDFE